MLRASVLNALVSLAFASLLPAASAFAAGDMLTPDEVQTTGISSNPANDSGLFLGAELGFGQTRTTEDGATPGLALLGSFEPGYQFNTGSWSRIEVSAQFLAGQLSYRLPGDDLGKVTVPVGAGVLAKFGYGYSLGNKATGILRLGVGPMLGKFEAHPATGKITSDGSITGLGLLVGWDMILPLAGPLDGVIGLNWLHTEFDVNDINSGGTKTKLDRSVVVNVPQALLGLRVRL